MWQPRVRAGRWVLVAVLAAGTGGCEDEPTRYGDYQDTGESSAGQCDVPVAQRQGGWVCPDS